MSSNNNFPSGQYKQNAHSPRMSFPSASTYMPPTDENYQSSPSPSKFGFPTPTPYVGSYIQSPPNSPAFSGGFNMPRTNAEQRFVPNRAMTMPLVSYQNYGFQASAQSSSLRYTTSTLPPYSNPPSYTSSSTSSGSGAGITRITADALRPIGLQFHMIELGMVDMMTCRDLFGNWATKLDEFTGHGEADLRTLIAKQVNDLSEGTSKALESSRQILLGYHEFASVMDESLQTISRSYEGGQIYPNDTLESLHTQIETQSSYLQIHVDKMQSNVFDLADLLSNRKREAEKHTLRRKIWGWLVKVFKAISATLQLGAIAAPFLHPAAVVAVPVIQGISKLANYVAETCKELEEHTYEDVRLDKILTLLRDNVNDSAGVAVTALGTFSQSLLLIQADNKTNAGPLTGWVESHEAAQAAKDWKDTREKLVKITQTCIA
ncbi:hypothetical protein SCHPADRAFT_333240 [Schizopora paradoxa]|uniref:Uncharacterized protein n=1 Tax=Schizopora paradoxa TaxID=27342 RepID=A0A0H2RQZ6_9AGAM|nr:hypothetical protein SCHPADRAFT_333240 [Schizopora paradoxa]